MENIISVEEQQNRKTRRKIYVFFLFEGEEKRKRKVFGEGKNFVCEGDEKMIRKSSNKRRKLFFLHERRQTQKEKEKNIWSGRRRRLEK